MGAQILFCFTAFNFLLTFVSLESAYASLSHAKNVTDFDSDKVIVNNNAVNLYPDKDVKTVLSQLRKKIESLERRMDALEKFKPGMSVSSFISACRYPFKK